MEPSHASALSDLDRARHDLRAHFKMYGEDLDALFFKLAGTEALFSRMELSRYGWQLDPERIKNHLENVIASLENLPLHLRIDDGAFQPPYKNVAFRAEARWHRDALRALADRLSSAACADDD